MSPPKLRKRPQRREGGTERAHPPHPVAAIKRCWHVVSQCCNVAQLGGHQTSTQRNLDAALCRTGRKFGASLRPILLCSASHCLGDADLCSNSVSVFPTRLQRHRNSLPAAAAGAACFRCKHHLVLTLCRPQPPS